MRDRNTKSPLKGATDMFVLKRNQIIITALVVMIGVAGYLSWRDTQPDLDVIGYQLTPQGEIAALIAPTGALVGLFPEDYPYYGVLGAPWFDTHNPAIAVSGEDMNWPSIADLDLSQIIALPTNEDNITEAGEAIFVDRNSQSPFFVQARLNREQFRSAERVILNDIMNNANLEPPQRAQAADQMLDLQHRIAREADVESLIESKGFTEVYVRISDNSVDIIVNRESLTNPELAQIMDIAMRKTGMQANQIHVSPMRR